MALTNLRLGTVFRGVEAYLTDGAVHFEVIVTAEALQHRFGSSELPEGWLQTVHDHASEIEAAAFAALLATGGSPVILEA